MEIFLRILKWSAAVGSAALVLSLVKRRLDQRYSAKWRYWAWLVMAVLLLLAPVPWGRFTPKLEAARPPVVIEIPQAQVTVSQREGFVPSVRPPAAATVRMNEIPNREALGEAYRDRGVTITAEAVVPALWALGTVLFALWHLVGTVWFARRAKRWSHPAGEDTEALCAAVAAELGLKSYPSLTISGRLDSPMVLGLFRPRLLLPDEDWAEGELRFILRHELTHYRRRDLWYKLLLLAANGLHWFNPLVYLLRREAEADLELTCDDAVVAGEDRETRRAYSETLLRSLHRQSGLGRSALSTHFYGGARVMKARFRNILSGGGRKWGAVALAVVLTGTLAAGCAIGFRMEEKEDPTKPPEETQSPEGTTKPKDREVTGEAADTPQRLSDQELTVWQEKLESHAYNGFLSRLYADVRELPLWDLLYDGAGISHAPEGAEREAILAHWGWEEDPCPIYAFPAEEIDGYLEETTGFHAADFRSGLFRWTYLEEYDSWYNAKGDTQMVGVQVASGTRDGDTVTLEVENGMYTGTLTVEDGKIRSFTEPLYAEAERIAWNVVDQNIQSIEAGGAKIVASYIQDLYCAERYEEGGKTYTRWNLRYRLKPEDMSKVMFAGGMSEEDGWVTETSSMGSPTFLLSVDEKGIITLEEAGYSYKGDWREDGYTWEEYIACGIYMGMELSYKLDGWPEHSTPLVTELLEGHNTWAVSRDGVALEYLREQGKTPDADSITVLRVFDQPENGDADEGLLLRVDCETGPVTLLMFHIASEDAWGSPYAYWQVNSVLWPNGSSQTALTGAWWRTQFDYTLGEGYAADLNVYGAQRPDGSAGVNHIEILWDGPDPGGRWGGRNFYIRDAIVAEEGAESTRYYTRAWDEERGLLLEDLNFDGYTDIGVIDADREGEYCYLIWLYDPENIQLLTKTYRYVGSIPVDVEIDPEAEELSWLVLPETGGDTYDRAFYRWENGELILDRQEESNTIHLGTATVHDPKA